MWTRLWNRVLFPFRRRRFDRELTEELDFHRTMLETDKTRAGVGREAAARAARRQLGNLTLAREEAVASWMPAIVRGFAALGTDVRDALRSLRIARGTTALALLILTLGITAGTVTFSVVDAVALRPLPYRDPSQLVAIGRIVATSPEPAYVATQEFFSWGELSAFEAMTASRYSSIQFPDHDGEPLVGAAVLANFFDVLGVPPALGRAFQTEDARLGSDGVIVLSHQLWRVRFGGDPRVIGRRITLTQGSRQVIGVMPEHFSYLQGRTRPAAFWVPYVPTESQKSFASRGREFSLQVVGRLRAGATIDEAQAQVGRMLADLARQYSVAEVRGQRHVVMPLKDFIVGSAKPWMLLLLLSVALVLLVSCVNVANLLLARAATRQRELATREALGAPRSRLARSLLCEGILLASAAAAAGVTFSFWGVTVAKRVLPENLARATDIAVDARVLWISLSAAMLCGLAFAAVPAWQISHSDLSTAIKSGGAAVIGGRRRRHWLGAFLAAEVAFVVTLLVATTLVVTSFIKVVTADLGFERRGVLTFSVLRPLPLPRDRQARATISRTFLNDVLAFARGVVGVRDAAIVQNGVPLLGASTTYSIVLPNGTELKGDDMFQFHSVTAGYFRTMGIPLERGRLFDDNDGGGAPVAIINDVAARRYFVGHEAIGQQITFRGPATIVGIVKSVRLRGPELDLQPELYVPVQQEIQAMGGGPYGTLVVRADRPSSQLAAQIAAAIQPALGGRSVQPRDLEDIFSDLTQDRRFNAGLLSIFGIVAIVIAAIGIYGVMAFFVAQQVRTIGLQIALGASPQRVLRGVLLEAGRYVLPGVAIGLVGARATSNLFTSLVFGVSTTDARVYLAVAAALAAIALGAALRPALRAASIDPLVALRSEN